MKNITAYLEQNDLFHGLTLDELSIVAKQFRRATFKKDQVIFNEGDWGDNMFFVIKGEASVLKNIGLGQRELSRLKPGESFGEMSLISSARRSATVKALSDTECMEMHVSDFARFLQDINQLSNNVMRMLSDRLMTSENQANKQILDAYNSLIFSLSHLAESRDPETGEHLKRVRDYCKLLSEKLLLLPDFKDVITPLFIDNIYIVSPLHDIGKVGIPDDVLLKPGKLSSEEFSIMKMHSSIGAGTLEKVMESSYHPTFQMAYNIVHYHHEKYDGSGYPKKLSKEDIPLEARIMALADVYDALLSKRVYKDAFSYEKTSRIIGESTGTHFDPVITKIMLGNIHSFEKIHKKYTDED